MVAQGLYLTHWSPYSNLESDVPLAIRVSMKLPFLPLHCWNDTTFKSIGIVFGKYIDRFEPHVDIFSYARSVLATVS